MVNSFKDLNKYTFFPVFISWALILMKRHLISCIGCDLWTAGFIRPGIRRFVPSHRAAIRNADKRLPGNHLRITTHNVVCFLAHFAAAGKLKCNNSSSRRGTFLGPRESPRPVGQQGKCAIIEKCGNKTLTHSLHHHHHHHLRAPPCRA